MVFWGAGGARQGAKFLEIGAQILQNRGVESFLGKPVGIQSRSNRDGFGHQPCIFLAPLLASRDPVGIQSGTNRAPILQFLAPVGKPPNLFKKQYFCRVLACFWVILAASRQVQKRCQKLQNWCPTGSRLDPDWIPIGSRLAKSGAKKNAKLVPDWIPTGSRLDPWIGKNPLSHLFSPSWTLCPYFPLLRTSRAPIPPPSCTKTAKAVLSQTGVLQTINLNLRNLFKQHMSRCLRCSQATTMNNSKDYFGIRNGQDKQCLAQLGPTQSTPICFFALKCIFPQIHPVAWDKLDPHAGDWPHFMVLIPAMVWTNQVVNPTTRKQVGIRWVLQFENNKCLLLWESLFDWTCCKATICPWPFVWSFVLIKINYWGPLDDRQERM